MPKFEMPFFNHEQFMPSMPYMPPMPPMHSMPPMPPMNSMPPMPPMHSMPPMYSMPPMPQMPMPPPLSRDMIRNHVAPDNEQYSGKSYSSHSHSTNINGEKTFEASVSSLVNDGHNVKEQVLKFKD